MASNEVITLKEINPGKLDVEPFRRALLTAVESEGKVQQEKLRQTTKGWRGARPTFDSDTSIAGGDLIVITGPKGKPKGVQKWTWLNLGTKRHPIRAKNAPALRFMINYIPSTTPGQFSSTTAAAWPPWRRKKEVMHPGIEPRRWTEILTKERQKPFERKVFRLLKQAADRAFP